MRCSMKVHNVQRALYVASYPWNKMAMRDKPLDNLMAENVVGWLLEPMFFLLLHCLASQPEHIMSI